MKTILFRTGKILLLVYLLICIALFFLQERLIFFPEKLNKDFRFGFDALFEERYSKTKDGKLLHGILFKAAHAKGLIFYLHGNAGALNSWGKAARRYTALEYDVFMLDYRGYGKSEGRISNQQQLFDDVQAAYDEIKKSYREDSIVVLGYSIGTGLAAKLASVNRPKLLILQAPYYSLADMMKRYYPVIPAFLLKYKLEINRYIKDCQMPIIIFHGDKDEVIPYNSSVRLKGIMKHTDTLITLHNQSHNGMTDNPDYIKAIEKILSY